MKPSWRYSLALLAGVAIGLCAGAGLVSWHWNRNFAAWHLLGVGDQANVAKEIYAGRGPELANRIRDAMPEYAAAVEYEFSGAAGRDWALWQIHDVYEAAGSTPPPEVQALFVTLPPRPSCKAPTGSSPLTSPRSGRPE